MSDRIPEWKLFLNRQLLRNQVSTMLCETFLKSDLDFDAIGERVQKSGKEVAHTLRPENINLDDIADVCTAMGVRPEIRLNEGTPTPSVSVFVE